MKIIREITKRFYISKEDCVECQKFKKRGLLLPNEMYCFCSFKAKEIIKSGRYNQRFIDRSRVIKKKDR